MNLQQSPSAPNGPQSPAMSSLSDGVSQQAPGGLPRRLFRRLPCCGTDPSNPCRPQGPHQSGYWLLISMVLLATVMVFPLLKGLLNVISAYINLLIFLCIFFFRKPETMAVMGVASVVIAHSFFGTAMYIHYADSYGSCEPLLLIGIRSVRNASFCHERSFEIFSILAGAVWLLIAGCLFKFAEVRRAELALQNFRQQTRQQQQRALQNINVMTEP